jgi:hypothetical protein
MIVVKQVRAKGSTGKLGPEDTFADFNTLES